MSNSLNHLDNAIDEVRADVLKEIGNIGSGHAANSLSIIVNNDVKMSVPEVVFLDANEASRFMGGPENVSVGIFFEIMGDFTGMFMLVVNLELADRIVRALVHEKTNKDGIFSEMQLSALSEVGNIFAYAYVNSISELLQMSVSLSTPKICVDMNAAILSIPNIRMGNASDKIMMIETQFNNIAFDSGSKLFLIPDEGAVERLMAKLGY